MIWTQCFSDVHVGEILSQRMCNMPGSNLTIPTFCERKRSTPSAFVKNGQVASGSKILFRFVEDHHQTAVCSRHQIGPQFRPVGKPNSIASLRDRPEPADIEWSPPRALVEHHCRRSSILRRSEDDTLHPVDTQFLGRENSQSLRSGPETGGSMKRKARWILYSCSDCSGCIPCGPG